MKKLTKLIFVGLLALAVAPAAVLSLTSMKEPVQVSAEGETRVYNIKDLKSALEGSQYSKIILDDELIIRDDVDPRPEVIFDAPEGYGQVPYITITSPKDPRLRSHNGNGSRPSRSVLSLRSRWPGSGSLRRSTGGSSAARRPGNPGCRVFSVPG